MNFGYILDIYSFIYNKIFVKILIMIFNKFLNVFFDIEMGYNILMIYKDKIF